MALIHISLFPKDIQCETSTKKKKTQKNNPNQNREEINKHKFVQVK